MATDLLDDRLTRPVTGRAPLALVLRDPGPGRSGTDVDWSRWYLTDEEDMGEGGEQDCINYDLKSSLREWARERRWQRVHIGHDQFFAWREDHPLVRVSPDVYLYDDPPPRPLPKMWQTWLPEHHEPRFAVEVVSEEWQKDHDDNPLKYAQLGTSELVVFDPEAAAGRTRSKRRVALQVFRRAPDGAFVEVYKGAGPVPAQELDGYLVVQRDGDAVSLRLARDSAGRDIVPTENEAAALARSERDAARSERDEQRAARDEAERKLAAALAELERLRGE